LRAEIDEPIEGSRVSGDIPVIGVADGSDFASYQLSFAARAQPDESAWQPVGSMSFSPSPAPGGLLAVWQTASLSPGIYTIRLTAYDVNGGMATAQVVLEVMSGS
jgi:hypothetical protein